MSVLVNQYGIPPIDSPFPHALLSIATVTDNVLIVVESICCVACIMNRKLEAISIVLQMD